MRKFSGSILVLALALAGAVQARPPKLPPVSKLNISFPAFGQDTLACGLKVLTLEDKELPLVSATLLMPGGYRTDPVGKEGLIGMLNGLMRSGGAGSRGPEEFDRAVEDRAASLSMGADKEELNAGFSCLSRDLPEVLDLFGDMVLRPRLDAERLEVSRMGSLDYISREEDSPDSATMVMQSRGFFHNTLYGNWFTPESVRSLKRGDLVEFLKRHYGPKGSVMVVSGSFDRKAVVAKLEELFKDWKPQEPLPEMQDVSVKGTKIYFFAKESSQVSVQFGLPGIKRLDPDFFPLRLANYALGGGSFGSRLMSRIRSDKGLAYGVGSSFDRLDVSGAFSVDGSTRPDGLKDYLTLMFQILDEYGKTGPTAAELADAKVALTQEFAYLFSSPHGLASQKSSLMFKGYPADYLETYRAKIMGVTRAQAAAAAKRILSQKDWVMSVSGPASLEKVLEGFGTVKVMKHVNDPL